MRDADQAGRLQRGHATAPAAPAVSVQRRHVANVSRWRWSQQGGAPIAPPGDGVRLIEGYVVDIASPGQGGPRILLAPIRISGLSPQATPIRVRVTLRGDQTLPSPGQAVALKGMVNAPPPPASAALQSCPTPAARRA